MPAASESMEDPLDPTPDAGGAVVSEQIIGSKKRKLEGTDEDETPQKLRKRARKATVKNTSAIPEARTGGASRFNKKAAAGLEATKLKARTQRARKTKEAVPVGKRKIKTIRYYSSPTGR